MVSAARLPRSTAAVKVPRPVWCCTRGAVRSPASCWGKRVPPGGATFRIWGEPLFSPPEVPCLVDDREVVSEYPVRVEGHQLLLNALSVGNPQCAILVERLPGPEQFQLLGSKLERHSLFPERTNVSFVQVISREQLSIQIWERGVGPTSSSGTGSCGAAVTAIRLGLVDSPVAVETRAGSQQVAWSPGKSVLLTGDAELVADGRCYWEP